MGQQGRRRRDDADVAFDTFVRAHGGELLRFAYLLCGNAARAEDVLQDALLKLLRRWRSHGPADHPSAYARRIVVNEYLAWRRLRVSTEVALLDRDDEAGSADGADVHADRQLMWGVLRGLPPKSRAVLVLRYYEQLPDREIAAWLGCAEATVRSIAARAFAALRELPDLAAFAPRGGEEPE